MYRFIPLLFLLAPVAVGQVCVIGTCIIDEPEPTPEPTPEPPPEPTPPPEAAAPAETEPAPAAQYAGYDYSVTISEMTTYVAGAIFSALAVWKLPWVLRGARFMVTVTGGLLGGALFSRIEGDAVLRHPTRARLQEIIASEPGIHVEALRRRVDVSTNTALHHLARLEKNGFVQVQHHGGRRRYYASGSTEARSRDQMVLLRHPTPRSIAKAVVANPGASQTELCHQLGLRKPSASKHLKVLTEGGLVLMQKEGRTCAYLPGPDLPSVLAKA